MSLRFLRNVMVLVALTLWSAASAHCSMEAAGFLMISVEADAGCCQPADGCEDDACDMVEGADYSAPTLAHKLPPPQLVPEFCLRCAHVLLVAPAGELVFQPETTPDLEHLTWVPIWHFARRAAPPSRAPSILS
ncbi:hypothetical protein [Synoicihabitans lomoniglobus]|uniref:Lipoprotein n=1 Tax=Synoicihabitans lomoniglobus TaxID=2909285 RepID=A0AAF0CR82_9BACT|nr:hypothetical protein [Opitutaceae bacterium LMO-M01]WED66590.1 hypothetical protein PXH66_06975 [Opitutaceae bacterium LMO-M01]